MREIKFRAYDLKAREWRYGSSVPYYGSRPVTVMTLEAFWRWVFEPGSTVDKDSMGQWTGMYAVGGVPVYEGDICDYRIPVTHSRTGETRYWAAERGVVTLGQFAAEIYTPTGWFLADKAGKQVSEGGLESTHHMVVGNATENYALLDAVVGDADYKAVLLWSRG